MIYNCRECGIEVDSDKFICNDAVDKGLCIDCNEFTAIAKNPNANGYLFIDGICYLVGTAERTIGSRGHAGHVFKIRLKCCGFTFETDNLWHCGEVPECFRDRLKDNADFIQN